MNKIWIVCSIVQTIIDLTKWTSHHHKMWLSIESFDAYVCHCGRKHVFFPGKGLNILAHVDFLLHYIYETKLSCCIYGVEVINLVATRI